VATTLAAKSDARTTPGAPSESEPRAVDPEPVSLERLEPTSRYQKKRLLGEGGMGEVHLCGDDWVGREVAMKVVRGRREAGDDLRERFLREARLQGQLEHPSIVPVYDLGVAPDGAAFFTMKRVKGVTLAEVIDGLAQGDAGLDAQYSRRKLLAAMSSVCLAVAFAHSRGVVHRDLKPDNVMLGDFGEVYVLDWGVAKIGTSSDPLIDSEGERAGGRVQTEAGSLLGTPGYASPEQVRGEIEQVGPASDIYALGAILFELLALEQLHQGDSLQALLASTLGGSDARPSQRARDRQIPPELDAICVRATAIDPKTRYSSARELHDAVDRYLDGERDAERRRELVQRHVVAAQVALALAARGGPNADAQRAKGMRELSAAIGLDPSHEGAIATLMQVLFEGGDELPPEAEAELLEVNRKDRAEAAKYGMYAYLSLWLFMPCLMLMGVNNWAWMLFIELLLAAATAYTGWMWRTGHALPRYMVWALPLNFLLVGSLSVFFGPYVIVPGTAAISAATFMVGIRANRLTRRGILLMALGSVYVPVLFQLLGLLPSSYAIEDGVLKIVPYVVDFPPVVTIALMAMASLLTVVSAALMVGRGVEALIQAERRNFAQAWRLRQLLPKQVAPAG
jgi:eukaryotic-like serine/threonine-protein kinase